MGSIEKPQHTKAVLDCHQDMVELREKIFMHPQAPRSYEKKVFIGTAATDADADIALSELQNIVEMEQSVFDKPLEIILNGDDKADHYGNWKTYRKKTA